MARVITPEISNVSLQDMHDGGINPYAVQLLVESFASPKRNPDGATPPPIDFVWRGVRIQMSVYVAPAWKRPLKRRVTLVESCV